MELIAHHPERSQQSGSTGGQGQVQQEGPGVTRGPKKGHQVFAAEVRGADGTRGQDRTGQRDLGGPREGQLPGLAPRAAMWFLWLLKAMRDRSQPTAWAQDPRTLLLHRSLVVGSKALRSIKLVGKLGAI